MAAIMKTNYHIHTTFCDGNGTPEEMVQAAVNAGFDIIGFSGHSMYPHGSTWHIQPKEHHAYFAEIRRLKEKYSQKIKIMCGLEAEYIRGMSQDMTGQYNEFKPEYLIGSVHYLINEKGFMTVDDSAEYVKSGIDQLYGGNGKTAVCEYYAAQREMLKAGGFQIWGHPDVIRKRNGILNFFDENDEWYRREIKETAIAAGKAGIIAEINTGGIARKCIDDVYPSKEFLDYLYENKVPVTLSSDSHSAETLDFAFDRAKEAAWKAGYRETAYLTEEGIKMQPLS